MQTLTIDRFDVSSERAPHKDTTVIVSSNKHLVMRTRRGSTSRHTDFDISCLLTEVSSSKGHSRVGDSLHLRKETKLDSEMFYFLDFRISDDGQRNNGSECYTPSLDPFNNLLKDIIYIYYYCLYSPLGGPWPLLQFLNHKQSERLLGRGISPLEGR
jgi:hypothetical protein